MTAWWTDPNWVCAWCSKECLCAWWDETRGGNVRFCTEACCDAAAGLRWCPACRSWLTADAWAPRATEQGDECRECAARRKSAEWQQVGRRSIPASVESFGHA